jgi:SWI/SNF related-matrix-associated actin-dependent regulator of chromatin subfamily C
MRRRSHRASSTLSPPHQVRARSLSPPSCPRPISLLGLRGPGNGGPSRLTELRSVAPFAGWFRWDAIHDTERQALPEFFGGAGGAGFGTATRNPRIYREYRDFIIGKYREDPARRLTFTEVRRALVGDVTLLRKLFAFLDASGLINFSATTSNSSRPAGQKKEAGVVVEAPVGLQVTPRPPASYFAEEKKGGGGESGFRLPPLTSYNDVFGEWTPGKVPICGFCGEDCKDGKFETLQVLINFLLQNFKH